MAEPSAPVKHPLVRGFARVLGPVLAVLGLATIFGGPKIIGIDLGSGLWYWVAGGCLFLIGSFVWAAVAPDDGRRGTGPLCPPGGGGGF